MVVGCDPGPGPLTANLDQFVNFWPLNGSYLTRSIQA